MRQLRDEMRKAIMIATNSALVNIFRFFISLLSLHPQGDLPIVSTRYFDLWRLIQEVSSIIEHVEKMGVRGGYRYSLLVRFKLSIFTESRNFLSFAFGVWKILYSLF